MSQVRLIKDRLLYFYSLLAEGKVIYKEEEAKHFNCSTRSIQRIEQLLSTSAASRLLPIAIAVLLPLQTNISCPVIALRVAP